MVEKVLMEILGLATMLCVFVVFCISLMPLSTANKVFFTTLILTNIILVSLFEAGIIFH